MHETAHGRRPNACGGTGPSEKPSVMILDHCGDVRTLEEIEADLIHLALSIYGGCVAQAARSLGIGKSTLYRRLAADFRTI